MDTFVSPAVDGAAGVEVLIAGAGPTGLVLAIDLARRGIRHRVVERSERGFPGSRGTGIQPRTLEVLDDLGAVAALQEAGGPCPPVQIWDGPERVRERDLVHRAEPGPATPYPELLMLPQWRTVEVLYGRLEELGGEVDFGTEMTGFGQDADGVTATLRRSDGSEETVRAEYLVAADGGRSTVRKALGVPFTGEPVDPRPVLIADVMLEGVARGHWHMWPKAEGGMLAVRPLEGAETFQVIAGYEDVTYEPEVARDATPEALLALLERRTGLPGLRVGEVTWASVYRARAAMAERFRTARVFLAGDAAHIHSPAGGQGLNTSVQDAYNLGWKLGAVLRHGAPEALLDSYDAERVRVAADVLGLSTSVHAADRAHAEDGLYRRGPETLQLDLNYREGPLTRELRRGVPEGALRAGDRAPDAPCVDASGAPVRLFDAFRGPHFTLLDLTGESAPPTVPDLPWLRTYRVGGPHADLHDTGGHAKSAYGSGLFLIRPDGYVGLATDEAGDVAEYAGAVAAG
ncbi:FAD-dependent monooxygenase [Streptomyces eurocidicus]|uniref:2-polyprenyl-6-methoxyphenol hydroxylase-like FAD-dependent oxidoreductase n=1 Tax=Streptomyces eurocidicus TaxID=66423 RepID=A0A7W8BA94_STREU|nr:FAD-dependent monooxygenase [Streptomyces eurocidicus]MBB5119650.1 2-polyprenyl-6-methoxyphenol hydroxylase-like FAD-dependent oxidoreductase [Streptomyces eurocidicus]